MKAIYKLIAVVSVLLPFCTQAQNYPHYTMFMFNKLIYNPGYAGNKNITEINATYRNQWTGLQGAPRTFNVSIDGPVGNYMKPFRSVALGLDINSEKIGVTTTTNILGYYAYRIPMRKTILSLGLQFGVSLYSANYSDLNLFQQDNKLDGNVKNVMLPNFGPGAYWTGERFYVGVSIPNLLENYYDKDKKSLTNEAGRQIRSYFISGGYVIPVADNFKLQPQALLRYAGDGNYKLPMNADLNLSCIFYDRLMVGVTYRTDKSLAGVVHVQATNRINIGYSYDYTLSELNGYNNGTHELTLGFDFLRDNNKYANPRFIKTF